MTETLQQKIDALKTSAFGCLYHSDIDKAIQELREEIIEEKNVTIKLCPNNDYNKGKIEMIDEFLALIGEKK